MNCQVACSWSRHDTHVTSVLNTTKLSVLQLKWTDHEYESTIPWVFPVRMKRRRPRVYEFANISNKWSYNWCYRDINRHLKHSRLIVKYRITMCTNMIQILQWNAVDNSMTPHLLPEKPYIQGTNLTNPTMRRSKQLIHHLFRNIIGESTLYCISMHSSCKYPNQSRVYQETHCLPHRFPCRFLNL